MYTKWKINTIRFKWQHIKNTKFADGNPGPGLEQAQKCGLNWIMGSWHPSSWYLDLRRQYRCKQTMKNLHGFASTQKDGDHTLSWNKWQHKHGYYKQHVLNDNINQNTHGFPPVGMVIVNSLNRFTTKIES